MKKHTVLYLNHTAKPGGAEFALARFLSAINRSRVKPIAVFADDGPAADMLRNADVETHVLPLDANIREVRKDSLGGRAFMHPGRAFGLVEYATRIARFARERGVDVLHTNSMKAHFYGALAGRLSGRPVVWHIRDFVNRSYLPAAAVHAVRLLARTAATHVVAVSRSVMDQLQLHDDGRHSDVVRDGLAAHELSAGSVERSRSARGPVRVGMVGRISPWKGQHVFLKAAAQILHAGHDARFSIAGAALFGEEEYERDIRSLASSLGISDRVEFLGFQNDVPAVMRGLDILVHASTSPDPCPNIVLEGMAAGLPVIGSDSGGVPELLRDGETGLLAHTGDAASLTEKIGDLIRDPARAQRIANAAGVTVRRDFTADRVARQLEQIYERILGGGDTGTAMPRCPLEFSMKALNV